MTCRSWPRSVERSCAHSIRARTRPRPSNSDRRRDQLDLAGGQLELAIRVPDHERLVEERRRGHDAVAVDDDRHTIDPGVVDHQPEVVTIRRLTAHHEEIDDPVHVGSPAIRSSTAHRPSLPPSPIQARCTFGVVVSIFVVRHAKAGSRHKWDGDDRHRPLSGQ